MNIPDHPAINNCERTGWPDGHEPDYPICPLCGEECCVIYYDSDDNLVGCNECIRTKEAWEVADCFPQED